MEPEILDWRWPKRKGWKRIIVEGAFEHPAKYSRGLILRIYRTLIDHDCIRPGDKIIDPFGGVALGALDAMTLGMHWTGIELEPKFVKLAQENIDLWNNLYRASLPNTGTARILQGDSRKLLETIRNADAAITSPPYSDSMTQGNKSKGYDYTHYGGGGQLATSQRYGNTSGQLGQMKGGDFDAAISSPPFRQTTGGSKLGRNRNPEGAIDARLLGRHAAGNGAAEAYGKTDGNIANLPDGDFDAAVSSPPYEKSLKNPVSKDTGAMESRKKTKGNRPLGSNANGMPGLHNYGKTDGNIGNETGETFWMASREIIEQTYLALKPGGYAVWVTKCFVRKGKIVPFSQQWAELCEVCGFETVLWARSWSGISHGTQLAIDGNHKEYAIDRKSFFRQHVEKQGSPPIDWEDVIFMHKPE